MCDLDTIIELDNNGYDFRNQLNTMRKEDRMCNVTIKVKDQVFRCHDLILATASPYFERMLSGDFIENHSRNDITLNDIEPEAFAEILSAIYTRKFHLHRGNIYFIARASHMLQLDEIFASCVNCMQNDMYIDYLVDLYLFSKLIDCDALEKQCENDLIIHLEYFSKTDFFNKYMSFDDLRSILSQQLNFVDDEWIVEIISRWNSRHACNKEKILMLFSSAFMSVKHLFLIAATELISSYTCQLSEKVTTDHDTLVPVSRNSIFEVLHNIYLDAIDVKTGAGAWICLQCDKEFENFKIADFQPSNFTDKKCAKIGNKLYCFECDILNVQNFFCVFENGQKKYLTLPASNMVHFKMEAISDFIYIMNEVLQLWMYACNKNKWYLVCVCNLRRTLPVSNDHCCFQGANDVPYLIRCRSDKYIYIIGELKRNDEPIEELPRCCYLKSKQIMRVFVGKLKPPYEIYTSHEQFPALNCDGAVCYYDGKIMISGGCRESTLFKNAEVCNISPLENWCNPCTSLKPMNIGRGNHLTNYHDGFIYCVENRWKIQNEKYNMKKKKWQYTPSLPQRIHFVDENIILATGKVFGYTIAN